MNRTSLSLPRVPLTICLQVIEVGQVGQLQALQAGATSNLTLFAHRQTQPSFGDASDVVDALVAAAQHEAAAAQVRLVAYFLQWQLIPCFGSSVCRPESLVVVAQCKNAW